MSSISCTKTTCKGARFALGRSCWQGQLIRGAQHVVISSTVTVTALVFAVFIKCPMFSNEQCDKAPYGPVGAARHPIAMLIIPLTFLMMASLFHLFNVSSFPTKTDRHQRTIPGARPYVSCLGRIEGANNIWGSRWFNPKTRYGQKKHLSEQMPTRVRAHRWPLGRHVLLKIVKRQKQHTCSVRA